MTTTVRFKDVSKKYRLGLTRTSVPDLVSHWVSGVFGRNEKESEEKKLLWALRNIDFELEQGQSMALIGANGAGKTTLLKLLANITKPSSGQIEKHGQLSALIELGAGFHPDLTGRENVFLNGSILGLSRKYLTKQFDEIVAFSELDRFIDTPVKRYSSGMKVRLGFAVASCIEPEILLVDEVLAVGDTLFRQKCMNRINELVENGTSIIFVSHNLWLVQAVCPLALYLEKGQIKYNGTTSEAINLYDRDLSEARARRLEAAQLKHTNVSGDIEITRIEVLNQDGLSKDELLNDEPVELRVHYTTYKPIGNINFVVRIIRSDGLTCCMIRTSLDQVDISVEPGQGTISAILEPLQLRGGSFYVQAMVRDDSDANTITSKSSDWFFVGGSVLTHSEMNGVFEPNRRWAHHHTPLQTLVNGTNKKQELTNVVN